MAGGSDIQIGGSTEDFLLVDPLAVLDASAHDGGHASVLAVDLGALVVGEGKVDPAVFGVVGMRGDFEQAALAADPNCRDARDLALLAVDDVPQLSVALGEEDRMVGEECDGPEGVVDVGDLL